MTKTRVYVVGVGMTKVNKYKYKQYTYINKSAINNSNKEN